MMMRSAVACAIFFLSFHANAQTYLKQDFSGGIPSDFTLIDNDGNTPSASMADAGFSVGTAWIAAAPTGESDMAACSTSWYSPSGQSDDWMITPAFSVADDNVALTWRAKASDKRYRDGYAVYVSATGGNTIADFDTTQPLFSVDQEESAWTTHTVSLDAYKGQKISIAFVNNSNNKSRLYVDDLFAGVTSRAYLKLDLGSAVAYKGSVPVSGVVYTLDSEAVSGYTIGLECGGNTYTQHFDNTIDAGQEVAFKLDQPIEIGWHETVDYTIWVEADGTRYEQEGTLTSYPRKVVCEDVTGTWCGYCVRGIVALNNIRQNYADRAFGLAVHSGDVMADALTNYASSLSALVPWDGLPAGAVNREYSCDPSSFAQYIDHIMASEPACVAMSMDAERDEATNQVKATTHLWFAADNDEANYRVAYVLIENAVHQPGNSKYKQHNSYAGGENGEMGGFENKPEYVPSEEMYYDDVVRCTIGDFDGYEGSVPTAIKAEEEITHTVEFSLPETVINAEETELVALVIDQADHHVVNAERIALGNGTVGIERIGSDNTQAEVVARYNMAGQKISTRQHGLNIVRMQDGTVRKVMVR